MKNNIIILITILINCIILMTSGYPGHLHGRTIHHSHGVAEQGHGHGHVRPMHGDGHEYRTYNSQGWLRPSGRGTHNHEVTRPLRMGMSNGEIFNSPFAQGSLATGGIYSQETLNRYNVHQAMKYRSG